MWKGSLLTASYLSLAQRCSRSVLAADEVSVGMTLGMNLEVLLFKPDPPIFINKPKWTWMGSLVPMISFLLELLSLQVFSPQQRLHHPSWIVFFHAHWKARGREGLRNLPKADESVPELGIETKRLGSHSRL